MAPPAPSRLADATSVADEAEELRLALEAFGIGTIAGIDDLELFMVQQPERLTEPPVEHVHTPGLYTRVCHIHAGVLVTSKIHNTEHPLFLLKGSASIWTKDKGVVTYHAPCAVVTKPDTRRIYYAHTDTIAVTCHPNPDNERDIDKIEARIMLPHTNPLLS